MAHEHVHSSGAHRERQFGAAFAIGIALNAAYFVAQIIYGLTAHSLALIADAGHNFGDVLGLVLAWAAMYLGKTRATERRTYGLGRSSILAALANAILLLVAVGAITLEAIRRFSSPGEVGGKTVMIVAALGIVINGVTARLFFGEHKHDLNIRGAFLHMPADAAVSRGGVVAAVIILFTPPHPIPPVRSLPTNPGIHFR